MYITFPYLSNIVWDNVRSTITNSNLQDNISPTLHNLGYDCCSLTLQPCRTPLVSPAGWLFDKEALLKYIIEKKQEYARKLKEYERQKDRDLKVFYIQFSRKNLHNTNIFAKNIHPWPQNITWYFSGSPWTCRRRETISTRKIWKSRKKYRLQ